MFLSLSDVEEDGLTLAAEIDIKCIERCAVAHRAGRDQRLAPLWLFDDVEHGVIGIGRRLVAEIHPRRKTDIDAARSNPEVDVRSHGLSAASAHDRAWLDG